MRGTPGSNFQGRRVRGRPKETWVRTMRHEAGEECWSDLEELAQDRWSINQVGRTPWRRVAIRPFKKGPGGICVLRTHLVFFFFFF